MKKKVKRLVVVLALAMAIAMIPMMVFAETETVNFINSDKTISTTDSVWEVQYFLDTNDSNYNRKITISNGADLTVKANNSSSTITSSINFDVYGTLVIDENMYIESDIKVEEGGKLFIYQSDNEGDKASSDMEITGSGEVVYVNAQDQYLMSKILAADVDSAIFLGGFTENYWCATASSLKNKKELTVAGNNSIYLNGKSLIGANSKNIDGDASYAKLYVPYGAYLNIIESKYAEDLEQHTEDYDNSKLVEVLEDIKIRILEDDTGSTFSCIKIRAALGCFEIRGNLNPYSYDGDSEANVKVIKPTYGSAIIYNEGEVSGVTATPTGMPEDDFVEATTSNEGTTYTTVGNISSVVPRLNGYTFCGWQDDETKAIYQAGDSFKVTDRNLVLTAIWEENEPAATTYTVTFNKNGADQTVATMTNVVAGSYITLPSGLTRTGKAFKGWTIDGILYAAGSSYQVNDNVTAEANFVDVEKEQETEYTVEYDANGGSDAPASSTNVAGTVIEVGDAPTTAKTDCTFTGYMNSYTGTIMQPGDSFTVMENTTFTAQWAAKSADVTKYAVTYDTNGATESAPATQKYAEGDIVTVSTAQLTKSDYTFLYWTDGTNKYAAGSTFAMPAQAVTLKAVWEQNATATTYTVSFDKNGADQTVATMTNVAAGSYITLPADLTQKGKVFKGWTIDGILYAAGSSYQVNDNVTAEAKFVDVEKEQETEYTVEYDANGGSGAPASSTNIVVGTVIKVGVAPTYSGHTFAGYMNSYTGTIMQPGDSFTVMANTTFTAQWTADPEVIATYDVTYDKDGATETAPATQKYAEGDIVTVSAAKLTKPGCTFLYWTDGTNKYAAGSTFAMPAQAVTLKAVWEQNTTATTYTVSFDKNGADQTVATMTNVVAGSFITLPSGLTKDNNVFTGWTIDGTLYVAGSNYQVNKDVNAQATFKASSQNQGTQEEAKYTVMYNANGGSGEPSSNTNVVAGTVQTVGDAPTTAKSGCTFAGYMNSYTGTVMQPGDSFTVMTNTTFTAQWVAKSTPAYNGGGSSYVATTTKKLTYVDSIGNGSAAAVSKEVGSFVTVNAAPVMEGYTFEHWRSNYEGKTYLPGDVFEMPKTDITLTAVWTKNEEEQKATETLSLLLCKGIAGNHQIKLTWLKENGADGYEVYRALCSKSKYTMISNTTKLACTAKNLNNSKAYKFYVKSYKLVNGEKVYISKSAVIHTAMKGQKCTNVKRIILNENTFTISTGSTATIKASAVKANKSKKYLGHTAMFRYRSTDKSVATVNKNGVITAKKAGTAKIYVLAENGVYKTVSVTVE